MSGKDEIELSAYLINIFSVMMLLILDAIAEAKHYDQSSALRTLIIVRAWSVLRTDLFSQLELSTVADGGRVRRTSLKSPTSFSKFLHWKSCQKVSQPLRVDVLF